MTVTAQLYDQYNAFKQQALDYASTTLSKDLSDIRLVIIPAGANINCGTSGNSAIGPQSAGRLLAGVNRQLSVKGTLVGGPRFAAGHIGGEVRIFVQHT
jgi:hypothetical protein